MPQSPKLQPLRLVQPLEDSPAKSGRDAQESLHAAIRANHPGWQRQAFDQYHALVHGLLLKALGPAAEVEDLTSDVFLSFFESAKRIRQSTAIRSYIVSITMNVIRAEIRQQKRKSKLFRETEDMYELHRKAALDDPRAKAALLQLSRILEELPFEERLAFVLYRLEGMDMAAVAAALEVSHSTAKRRLRRASEHLVKRVSRNALLADYVVEKAVKDHD